MKKMPFQNHVRTCLQRLLFSYYSSYRQGSNAPRALIALVIWQVFSTIMCIYIYTIGRISYLTVRSMSQHYQVFILPICIRKYRRYVLGISFIFTLLSESRRNNNMLLLHMGPVPFRTHIRTLFIVGFYIILTIQRFF